MKAPDEFYYIFNEDDKEFLDRIYFKYETFDQFELYESQEIKNVSKLKFTLK